MHGMFFYSIQLVSRILLALQFRYGTVCEVRELKRNLAF
jgi:hypothetical protein